MITLKQINNQQVKAIPLPEIDPRPVKGCDICSEIYANIFLCAKKKSGKTSALFKILKECTTKKTIIIVFCSTVYKDPNWIEIRKYFEKKGNDIRIYTSLYEDGEDELDKLIHELSEEAKEEEKEEDHEEKPRLDKCDEILVRLGALQNTNKEKEEKPRKPKKCKYQSPEYIIVFDDLSTELKSRSLLSLLKKNRHFKTKLIISSQWIHDLLPESRKQIDLFLIFKGFPEKKLGEIYKDCDSGLPFETFYEIYKKSTIKPYSFMYICTRSDSYRCNFDKQFIITE